MSNDADLKQLALRVRNRRDAVDELPSPYTTIFTSRSVIMYSGSFSVTTWTSDRYWLIRRTYCGHESRVNVALPIERPDPPKRGLFSFVRARAAIARHASAKKTNLPAIMPISHRTWSRLCSTPSRSSNASPYCSVTTDKQDDLPALTYEQPSTSSAQGRFKPEELWRYGPSATIDSQQKGAQYSLWGKSTVEDSFPKSSFFEGCIVVTEENEHLFKVFEEDENDVEWMENEEISDDLLHAMGELKVKEEDNEPSEQQPINLNLFDEYSRVDFTQDYRQQAPKGTGLPRALRMKKILSRNEQYMKQKKNLLQVQEHRETFGYLITRYADSFCKECGFTIFLEYAEEKSDICEICQLKCPNCARRLSLFEDFEICCGFCGVFFRC